MKRIAIFIALMLLISCTKKAPTIAWENNTPFAEITASAGDKHIMIDFVRDG